jgi:hypothetical protein
MIIYIFGNAFGGTRCSDGVGFVINFFYDPSLLETIITILNRHVHGKTFAGCVSESSSLIFFFCHFDILPLDIVVDVNDSIFLNQEALLLILILLRIDVTTREEVRALFKSISSF